MQVGKFPAVLGLLCLSLSLSAWGPADASDTDLARFTVLARKVTETPITEQPTEEMSEALEILHRAAFRICSDHPALTDKELEQQLKPFEQKLNPAKTASGLRDPIWFDAATSRRKNLLAIAVTFGAVSRLKVYDTQTGKTLVLPSLMNWFFPFHPHPHFADDTTLLFVSETVQDAGVRVGLRLDTLYRKGQQFTLTQTVMRQYNLQQPPPQIHANRLTITSVQDPKNFFFASADMRLECTEVFKIKNGRLHPLSQQKKDRALRAVDAWISTAKRVPQPNSHQRLIRRYLSHPTLVDDCSVKRISSAIERVTLTFDTAIVHFTVKAMQGTEKVLDVQTAFQQK